MKRAYLGGGCFWGMEHYFRKLDGVTNTSVGFMGGDDNRGNYEQVASGTTGHAEVVEIEYDDSILSYKDILLYFFRLHDPTTLNRQHNDIGTQYRSAIFTSDKSEIEGAKELINTLDQANVFESEIVTTIEPLSSYHKASDHHQDYLIKYPNGYNCHSLRPDFEI